MESQATNVCCTCAYYMHRLFMGMEEDNRCLVDGEHLKAPVVECTLFEKLEQGAVEFSD